jgi:hypothetical protein
MCKSATTHSVAGTNAGPAVTPATVRYADAPSRILGCGRQDPGLL